VAVVCPVLESWRGRLDVALFRLSAFWRFLHPPEPVTPPEAMSGRRGEPSEGVIYPFREHWTDVEEEAWGKISKSLGEMDRLCRAKGARLHLLLIPPGNQVSPDAWRSGKQLMGFGPEEWVTSAAFQDEAVVRASRIGIPVTDLLPPFRAHPHPGTLYFDTDGHWTPEGHQLAAQILLKDERIEGLTP
jgi:hypothetical protein